MSADLWFIDSYILFHLKKREIFFQLEINTHTEQSENSIDLYSIKTEKGRKDVEKGRSANRLDRIDWLKETK